MTLLRRVLARRVLEDWLAIGAGRSRAAALAVFVPTDAHASVSIAVGFDALVKDADSVGVVTPVESKTVWEDGRIYTYTRVKVDQGVAGELGTGADGWVRTMGGVVGKIGQLVDGEPVFTTDKSSLVFLRKFEEQRHVGGLGARAGPVPDRRRRHGQDEAGRAAPRDALRRGRRAAPAEAREHGDRGTARAG